MANSFFMFLCPKCNEEKQKMKRTFPPPRKVDAVKG